MPHELTFIGVYLSPLFLLIPAGVCAAVLTAVLLNRLGLSRFFANPPWVFLALLTIYICLIGSVTGSF